MVPFLFCIENEESNLTEVLALRKQFGELFLATKREAGTVAKATVAEGGGCEADTSLALRQI